ncbi:DUF6635 family protein [Benzoatithermus flavus]|uniref:DUF6635 family protein n=1 Tax=Benzoatithermus flavus TaxID=3108223 RepID=A0ABU8XVW2_9PROT
MMVPLDPILRAAVMTRAAACRARIPAFTARHFGLAGAWRLHREALGLDLLRAPLNVLLVGPALFLRIAAMLLRRLGFARSGTRLERRNPFLETRLARRIADLVLSELLRIDEATVDAPASRERAHHLIAEYVAARHAVAEFAAALVALAAGLVLVQALTPGAISLGPILAKEMAQREAVEGFWLGSALGGLYHAWFPADVSWTRTVATTFAVMIGFALLATFTGLVTDPLQELLGLHRRRLRRLVDTLERVALGESEASLALPDPWVARLVDLADAVLMAMRLTR